jgi:hypothetical protein
MPEIIGELPKPRLLVLNAADSIVTAIERLAPTTRFITTEELSVIRQRDWDGAIAFGNAISLESHLFVIQFGGTWGGVMPSDAATGRDNYQLKIVPSSNTVQFRVPDSLPTTVRPLIQSLTRLVTSKSMNSVMWAGMHGYANECRPTIETPFIEDDDDYVLA